MGVQQNDEPFERIEKKLDILIAMRVADRFEDTDTVKDKVAMLHKYGITDNELMANVIGTTKNTVSTKKSNLKSDGDLE